MPKTELTEEAGAIPAPKYDEQEEKYVAALKERLRSSKDQRDTQRDEWDGMDYLTQYEANERAANTFISPKKNKEDTNFQSGVVRTKLFALLASLVNLNLKGDVSAYDRDALKVQALGDAMEDIIAKTDEMDGDEEKKFVRFYELLKHGTVFVEEVWLEQERKTKKMKRKFDGKVKGASWDEKVEKAFARPTRNVIPGTNVYLGDITKYDVSDQPFVFTVDVKPYDEAKALFGSWERWQNVPRTLVDDELAGTGWLPEEDRKDKVLIVRYQDRWSNESAILCNWVLMTPVGLPLPYGMDDYTIVQQNLEPIHSKFAYGKSLVARIKNKAALLDEFMRLGILKTQKSFMPPYLNLSGRMLTSRVLMPGKITHGIPPNSLVPVNDKEAQGISTSELAMIRQVQESIDAETVSPVFAGTQPSGNPTATEIVELQRQARMVLGLTIFAASTLEWKLTWKRLKCVISNWFVGKEGVYGEGEDAEVRTSYDTVGTDALIDGEGQGRRIIVPTKKMPTAEAVFRAENALAMEQGMPIRLIFVNPDDISLTKLFWQVAVVPKEKRSSEVDKLLFRAEMADAQMFGPLLNVEYLAEKFASVWNENPQKMFRKQEQQAPGGAMASPALGGGQAGRPVGPEQSLPTAEGAAGAQMKAAMGMTQ